MKRRTALITGANGGIGQSLCITFQNAGWRVIASDQDKTNETPAATYITMNLARLCRDKTYQKEIFDHLRASLNKTGLHTIINNAATQIIAPVEELTVDDWHNSLDVNLVAPFLLTQALLPELQKTKGSVINIASIHSHLTKPSFTAYATSKAALLGLTRSLAVELGDQVRVNAICPAAIATPMLEAGFNDNPHGLNRLASYHPSRCIGTIKDVGHATLYLAEADSTFLNGTVINLDGGIGFRLHDPS